VCLGDLNARCSGELTEAAGRGVPVHPGAAAVQQDRAARTGSGRLVDGPAHCGRQRHQDDLGAFAAHTQDPVTVLFADVSDVRGGGFEDPQAEQAEHGDQREVVPVRRLAGGGEQSLELQVRETEGRQLGRNCRAADVLGG